MKKKLIIAYWLMLVAWSLFLNSWTVSAILAALLSTLILAMGCGEVDPWRITAVSLLFYNCSIVGLHFSNIPLYFSGIYIFMNVVCINAGFVCEYLCHLKKRFILPVIYVILLMMFVLCILIAVLPEELYTMFTKLSLFSFMGFIFLPYLLPLLIAVAPKPSLLIQHKKAKRAMQQ